MKHKVVLGHNSVPGAPKFKHNVLKHRGNVVHIWHVGPVLAVIAPDNPR